MRAASAAERGATWAQVLSLRLERQHLASQTTPDCVTAVAAEAVLARTQPFRGVRLLPGFDPFTNELPRRVERVLPAARHHLVHRTAGWVTPIVIVDGEIAGTWGLDGGRSGGTVSVVPFSRWRPGTRKELASEVDRLAAFVDRRLSVTVEVSGR